MKILFSVGEFEPILGANTKLVINIAKEMEKRGEEVFVAGATVGKESRYKAGDKLVYIRFKYAFYQKIRSGILWYKYKAQEELNELLQKGSTAIKAWFRLFTINPLYFIAILIKEKYLELPFIPVNYARTIRKIAKAEKITDLICLQEPSWATNAVVGLKLKNINLHIYQVDPCGLQVIPLPTTREFRRKKEKRNFSFAKNIFTTNELYQEYIHDEEYRCFVDKMTAIEFPNLTNKEMYISLDRIFDNSYINILFSGMLHKDYRSPKAFLEKLGELIESGYPVRCYFQGEDVGANLEIYLERYPNHIFWENRVSAEKAYGAMMQADFLLNIGNLIPNMVPSKIFDYFSTGKPIINIERIHNCPSHRHFSRYPLALNLNEPAGFTADEIKAFLEENRHKRLKFQDVKNIFIKATPEYVALKFISTLRKGTDECLKQ